MLAILKRELKVYYSSLFAYLYYALFFMVTGLFFSANCLDTHSTEFGYYVIGCVFYVMVAVLPFCTMKLFAMERKQRTDQLLFTAPVSSFSVLAAKYLATVIFALLPLAISSIYPIYISMHGTMSVRFVLGSYIGCTLSVLVLLSIGMLVSTLTTNVVLAVVISYVVYVVTLMGRVLEAVVSSDGLYSFFHEASVYNKFNDMISGIVRSGDVIYLITLSVVFFLLTWIVLESRRQSMKKMIAYAVGIVFLGVVVSFLSLRYTKVYDFTAEQLLSLTEQTKEIVSSVEKTTKIYYIGERSRANATYVEFLNQYDKMSDNVRVYYKNVENDTEFQMKYLSNVSEINESSILVVCDERYIYLDAADYIKTSQLSTYTTENTLELEWQLTSAIYFVNAEEASKLSIISGHSEELLNGYFSNMLYLNGYEMETVNMSSKMQSLHGVFDDDCQAVIVNAPQMDYEEEEIEELENYLEDGGNLFVILDPLNEELPNLYAFLKEYGLDVQSGVVIEREQGMYADDTVYYLVPELQDNDYTKEIIDKNLYIHTMTSKGILPNGSGNGYTSTDILMTSGKSFSKVDDFDNMDTDGDSDIGGPFSVASCASNPDAGSIFLVTSNVLFNEQADAESMGANRKFFLEIMKQLTDEESTIWIDGKLVGDQVALYPYGTRDMVRVITIAVIPVCILLFGIVVVVIRNNNLMYRMIRKRDDGDGGQKEQNDSVEESEE